MNEEIPTHQYQPQPQQPQYQPQPQQPQQPITLTEIMGEVAKAKQRRTLVKKLHEYDSFALRTLLQGNYDTNIGFPFPSGTPPFTANEERVEPNREIISRIGACTKNSKIDPVRKETQFISFLESIHHSDAELFCLMKDRALEQKFPWLSRELVKEAFPNLIQ